MEIAEYRVQAEKIGLPQEMIEGFLDDYIRDSKEGDAVPLEEILDMAKEAYPDGFVDPRE